MNEVPPMNEMLSWLIDQKRKAERESADFYAKLDQCNARIAIINDAIDRAEELGAVR